MMFSAEPDGTECVKNCFRKPFEERTRQGRTKNDMTLLSIELKMRNEGHGISFQNAKTLPRHEKLQKAQQSRTLLDRGCLFVLLSGAEGGLQTHFHSSH